MGRSWERLFNPGAGLIEVARKVSSIIRPSSTCTGDCVLEVHNYPQMNTKSKSTSHLLGILHRQYYNCLENQIPVHTNSMNENGTWIYFTDYLRRGHQQRYIPLAYADVKLN